MKIVPLLFLGLLVLGVSTASAHGPGHVHRGTERAAVDEALELQETAIPVEGADADRWWGVNVNTGWESRHVHYGVDESGPTGAYVNEVGVRFGDLSFNVWNGLGTGNTLLEWDFTVAYNIDLGPVFIVPGYNLRYVPSYAMNEEEHEETETPDPTEPVEEHTEHVHNTVGNELFIVLGTTAIPYVTPSVNFIWDLNNNPGGFMEARLDGNVPLYKDIVSLQPYALLGLNFGYNTSDYYGWNNFQFGGQVTTALTKYISVFAGVNYSVSLEAMQQIDQENIVWANVGFSFAY